MKHFAAVIATVLVMSCSNTVVGPGNSVKTTYTLSTTETSVVGTVVRVPDKQEYDFGDTVKVTATAASGYTFTGWHGDYVSITNTMVIVMQKNVSVFADFVNNTTGKKVFTILTSSENGSIGLLPLGGVYDSGTVISVNVMHDSGVVFANWSGLLNGTDSASSLVVSRSGTITANFILDPKMTFFTIRVNPQPLHGRITFSPPGIKWGDGYKYKPGTDVTLIATPDSTYELVSWGGNMAPLGFSEDFIETTIDSDITISATFSNAAEGRVWTSRNSGNGNGLIGVAWNGSLIVVVGNTGTILTSPDGVAWTARVSGVTSCLNCVIWAGTQFVAVGDDGTILTSGNGTTWTIQNSSTTYGLQSVVWTGSQYVAVGGQFINSGLNYNNVVTSRDGTTWTKQNGGIVIWYSIAWTGKKFIAIGYNYDFTTVSDYSFAVMYESTDGVSWTSTGTGVSDLVSLNSIIWGG